MKKIEVVSASAGSGKTSRVARELRERIQRGDARPEAVLATTFTNKAAAELKERARAELFRAGLHDEALRLEGARIGTVNSVCGRLVSDFAFELGLSPELRVLDEDQAAVALRRVITRVITDIEREQLSVLAGRMDDFDWQKAVERLLVFARTNLLTDEDLQVSAARSEKELLAFLPASEGISHQRDQAFRMVIEESLGKIDPKDETQKTSEARAKVQEALSALQVGAAPWKLWAKAKGATAGKKSDKAAFDPIRAVAAQVDTHPRLREDLANVITLVFALTRRTLREWQNEKRELGVLDFVDQETLALDLLKRPDFAARISEELDLVLVDEFQDTSPLQLELFTRLAELAKDSLWVGDQKQAIFGFRGTDPALMDAALDSVLAGREPETLSYSYRSRAPLVEFTSSVFAKAFAPHGLPEKRVRLVPAHVDDPKLGSCLESWAIGGKNRGERLASLADGVVRLLEDPTTLIRDRADGSLCRPTAADVAVLFRKNADCELFARALAARGLSATVRQAALLSTPEARAAVLALRLFIDARDRLAAAELARLLLHPHDPDGWLDVALENAGEVPFEAAPFHAAINQAREQFPAAGPLAALAAAVDGLGLREVLPRWGDSARRHANLDALRGHAVDYVARADADGSAATPAGLVAYFDFIEAQALDSQATLPGADSVVVSTWHAAKGLEWPVTVLGLVGSEPTPPRFGFSVRSTKAQFSLAKPLEGRWVRYWPNPFHPSQKTELRIALEAAPEAAAEKAEAEKQELRLLYVGWTRARDRLVLARGDGGWMLESLAPPVMPVTSGAIEWAGLRVDVQVRDCEGLEDDASLPEPDDAPVPRGPLTHPAAFISPSTLEGVAMNVEVSSVGERLLVMGDPDMNELGQALHGFLAVDRASFTTAERVRLAAESLSQWGQSGVLRPERMVAGSDALIAWAQQVAPEASWHREFPVDHLLTNGSRLRGIADLVLETADGFWLIDHKSFPGGEAHGAEKAKTYAGQLKGYSEALAAAWVKPCRGMFVHLAVLGRIVQLAAA
ncbi:MAG: UvrD-helicase domain-containing protein [Archangium sp.]|nr:UvrD-helicase domain-containing protein [Archangium sp.]MDP3575349.1 UvrD-helicase domain-containing protein [Archangium sp.]